MAFSVRADGNVAPVRSLHVPHQAWGIALSDKRDEVAVSVEGPRTDRRLQARRDGRGEADPHAARCQDGPRRSARRPVRRCPRRNDRRQPRQPELRAASEERRSPASLVGGRWEPPSITVFSADANGDTAPLRTIAGSQDAARLADGRLARHRARRVRRREQRRQLDPHLQAERQRQRRPGPHHPGRQDRHRRTDERRVRHEEQRALGRATTATTPALVFARDANGNVAPKRILRNAPTGAPTVGLRQPRRGRLRHQARARSSFPN